MKTLSVINPNAAGIDVGSEKLFVSIAGEDPEVFGTVTNEVYRMRDFLKQRGVTTVAMEATGVYWLYAYAVLEAAGLEVIVVNGRYVRNLPGRKTDMQQFRNVGLTPGVFAERPVFSLWSSAIALKGGWPPPWRDDTSPAVPAPPCLRRPIAREQSPESTAPREGLTRCRTTAPSARLLPKPDPSRAPAL
jgi:hypothetical protein